MDEREDSEMETKPERIQERNAELEAVWADLVAAHSEQAMAILDAIAGASVTERQELFQLAASAAIKAKDAVNNLEDAAGHPDSLFQSSTAWDQAIQECEDASQQYGDNGREPVAPDACIMAARAYVREAFPEVLSVARFAVELTHPPLTGSCVPGWAGDTDSKEVIMMDIPDFERLARDVLSTCVLRGCAGTRGLSRDHSPCW